MGKVREREVGDPSFQRKEYHENAFLPNLCLSPSLISRADAYDNQSSSDILLKTHTPPEKMNDEDFDMKGTSRKEYENEYYKRICSEIIEGFLYLGSDFIAQDKDILK